MVNSLIIPQDIIDNVIAVIGNVWPGPDRQLLKQCALVSSSFLLPCRKQLFSEISLRTDQGVHRLHQFLVENPVIQSFVKRIDIWRQLDGTSLPALLQLHFCCLETLSFEMNPTNSWKWNKFSSELKTAITNIIHSSTLKTLCLAKITIPLTLFLGVVHLRKLELHYILPKDFDEEQSISADLKGVTATASHPVIDQCVWCLSKANYEHSEPMFLPFMCRLVSFKINAFQLRACHIDSDLNALSVLMHSLCMSLTSPATFKHLELYIYMDGFDYQDFDAFSAKLHDAALWSVLDSIVTRPIGSQLTRVNIEIEYCFYDGVGFTDDCDSHILGAVLNCLPLLHKKGILLVEVY